MLKKYLPFALFAFSLQADKSQKNIKHKNIELNYIINGSITEIENWVAEVVKSNNYTKYIRHRLSAAKSNNTAKIVSYLPSINSTLNKNHLYKVGNISEKNKFKNSWDYKKVSLNLLSLKSTSIGDIFSAGIKSKVDLEEYWNEWSKFCLEELIENLVEWIAQKAIVKLNLRITSSRKNLLKQVKARIQTGTMTKADLHSAEANLSTSETELFVAQNKEKVLRHKLMEFKAHKMPDKIGQIPNYGNWNSNKLQILKKSPTLLNLYHIKRHSMAQGSSKLMVGLPNINISVSAEKSPKNFTNNKWNKSVNISLEHHIGLDTIATMMEGSKTIKAARFKYLDDVRKTIANGYEIFSNLQNSQRELEMHQKSLTHHEEALRSKNLMFQNDIELQNKRKVFIDDVIYAENNVSFACSKTIETYKNAVKLYFKLLHLKGELANKIGNRRNINKNITSHINQLAEESSR